MYDQGERVTLDTLLARVQEDLATLDLSRSSLRKLLLQNGYRFRSVDKRRILMEKPAVVSARASFLRTMRSIRASHPARPIVYLDETWFNQHDYDAKYWLDDQEFTGHKTVIGKGKRLVIIHAESRNGFVSNCFRAFWSDGKLADYHESMNSEYFEEWFSSLIKQLQPNSVIVMDNASYHSRQLDKPPTAASKKEDLKAWLFHNDVPFEEDMLKVELLELVKKHQGKPTYAVDDMAERSGHKVVRLAPYHCVLNPIELIWAQVKGYVRKHNKSGRMEEVRKLVEAAVEEVTPVMWEKCCDHVCKLEQEFWTNDRLMDDIGPFTIDLRSDSSDSSDGDEE
ncbi:uncharacterized protein LOC122370105 [Amphibalanus amphitrite]|uniref:uncharacterized protein LOC122370105 n=1 Tax=Amphibalanus amphitrite TaxID=1232801 RepID=UPI001C91CE41|nr:uncharacterized protein LOC122370105 [Amphibalanus amphitrite]